MNYQELLKIKDDEKRAYELVKLLFKDKKDKEGEPYIGHLERVSNKLTNQNTRIAGLLHDTVEDTNITFDDLRKLKFNEEIINLVKLVTNSNKNQSYHEKISSIIESNNIEAIKIKYSDMLDNSNPERLNKLSQEKQEYFINKYQPEIIRLENILKERGEKL